MRYFIYTQAVILLVVCSFSCEHLQATPLAIVDYLGPDDELSGYHSDDGLVQNYVIGGMTQKYQSIAIPFWIWTDEDVYLTNIEAGLERLGYDGDLRMKVVSDTGGMPGIAILEDITVEITSTAVYTFEASGTARLVKGEQYWLIATADYPSKFGWHQPADFCGYNDYLINTGSGWNSGPWNGNLAVRINAMLVPEPATVLLLSLGGLFFRKRKY